MKKRRPFLNRVLLEQEAREGCGKPRDARHDYNLQKQDITAQSGQHVADTQC
jgi:hypothetical protein